MVTREKPDKTLAAASKHRISMASPEAEANHTKKNKGGK